MSCGYNCENSCEECDRPNEIMEFIKGYNQALDDFATALLDGEQNEEFVYNIEKIVERLRK